MACATYFLARPNKIPCYPALFICCLFFLSCYRRWLYYYFSIYHQIYFQSPLGKTASDSLRLKTQRLFSLLFINLPFSKNSRTKQKSTKIKPKARCFLRWSHSSETSSLGWRGDFSLSLFEQKFLYKTKNAKISLKTKRQYQKQRVKKVGAFLIFLCFRGSLFLEPNPRKKSIVRLCHPPWVFPHPGGLSFLPSFGG